MRKTLLALSLVLAPSLIAQTADMRILSASPSVTLAATGKRFAMFARWRNDGPDAAHFVKVTVSGTPSPFYVISVATSGWPCYASPDGNLYTCEQAEVAAGGEAELVLTMLTPATPGPFVIRVEVRAAEQDSQPENNIALISSVLQAAPSSDLSISPTSQLFRADEANDVSVPIVIANRGPNPVRNITALLSLPFFANAVPPMAASGTGWVCLQPPYGPQSVLCSRSSLAVGEVAPITVTTVAPVDGGTFTIHARVSGEDYSDPSLPNNAATATVTSDAEVESWTRILLPLIGPDVHGTNNALWRTHVTAMVASDTGIDIHPRICEEPPLLCAPAWPLRVPFDAYFEQLADFSGDGPGHILYLPTSDEPKLHLNARVYDVSRITETAGSEIPVARERDFTSEPISLLGIPAASHYRHTLRVYDLDGRDGAQVAIRIYAGVETTPRLTITRALTAPGRTISGRTVHPGMIQLELGQLLPLAGIDTLRVDVEPLDNDLRLWSFVSVTNNDTHHVTTFSAHVGSATTEWTRILVPLPPGQTRGANGSFWTTKTTALLRSRIEMRPFYCEELLPCPAPLPIPILQPFDLVRHQLRGGGLGEFVLVRTKDASQIRLNSRVWDASRQTETAGSEIPIPRDDDFTKGTIALLGIPVAAHYRHTLRVYDLDGRNGARVALRIYADAETNPRATTTGTLTLHSSAFHTTDQLLSTRPASLQLDPLQLASLAGASSMRIEIEPLDEGTRIWSFLSVTNNDTHHVTTFSAQ